MHLNPEKRFFANDTLLFDFIVYLEEYQHSLGLDDSEVYCNYPLYRDFEGDLIRTPVLIVSPLHGILIFIVSNATDTTEDHDLYTADENVSNAFNQIYSRLVKNKNLKKSKKDLLFDVDTCIYAPLLTRLPSSDLDDLESVVVVTKQQIEDFFVERSAPRLNSNVIANILSSIDGAGGIVRAKPRVASIVPGSKGDIANQLEAEILTFDRKQKHGYVTPLEGIERIRGLAGSGKTVVLAMKAALTHLENPDATILFTFYTKSLYQHIQRLITRFYKQFSEYEPDFEKIQIMHAWGGRSIPGVYYETCLAHGIAPISFDQARTMSYQPFDYVCNNFLSNSPAVKPLYDYVFIDEGQDFPTSFIKLCARISREHRLVLAYDELQTIFQPTAPSYEQLFGDLTAPIEDVVLYKCYRNPREIIVCAHALGFGIYSPKIVQMLENKEHWEDVGYIVHEGEFKEGSDTVIERPAPNSLSIVSNSFKKQEIVKARAFPSIEDEAGFVAESIRQDIQEGLRPDDILVEVVDDRNAKAYLTSIEKKLGKLGICTHNVHADSFGLKDFQKEGCVTLSTVHKAKGNESFMVYVVGVDAVFSSFSGVRDRNILFTAMTRAKGWVYITGVGELAEHCKREVDLAMDNYPYLRFPYPSEEQLKVMKRDLQESDIKKQKIERIFDEMLNDMSPDDIKQYVDSMYKSKSSKNTDTTKKPRVKK